MQDFKYLAPTDLEAVLAHLAAADEETLLLGGGTATALLLKQDLIAPATVIGLGRIPGLRGISREPDGGLRLGATCTLAELERDPALAELYPVLTAAAHGIGNVRVRSVATLGGHLIHADPAQDLPPVLMALDATVTLVSRAGARRIPLDELIVDTLATSIRPDEVLTAVHLPPPPAGLQATYIKFTPRSRDDFATVGVACALTLDGGRCQRAAVALGGVGATPLRIPAAEAELAGRHLTAERIAAATRAVPAALAPWDDARGSAEYKREMAAVWTGRALAALGQRAGLTL